MSDGRLPRSPSRRRSPASAAAQLASPILESGVREDALSISWRWPSAPAAKYEYELRWREHSAREHSSPQPEAQWQHHLLGHRSAYRHTISGLSPDTWSVSPIHCPIANQLPTNSPPISVQLPPKYPPPMTPELPTSCHPY